MSHSLPTAFLLLSLAAHSAAQAPVCYPSGQMEIGQSFYGTHLAGPAGIGAIFLSPGLANPPLPTPFGPLRAQLPLLTVGSGPISPGAPLSLFLSIPANTFLLGKHVAFTAVAIPTASGVPVLANSFLAGIGPWPSIGPLQNVPFELFGRALACSDRDMDGKAEVIVGAPGAAAGTATLAGRVGIYSGTPLALVQTLSGSSQGGARYGHSLAEGQLDGLLGRDLVVGEPLYDASSQVSDVGRVHVHLAPGYTTTIVVTPPAGSLTFARNFGATVLAANLDGTGNDKLVIGGPCELGTGVRETYVYSVSAGSAVLSYTLASPNGAKGSFGREVAAGNLEGGAPYELAVADRGWAPNATSFDHGRVHVFSGTTLLHTLTSPNSQDNGKFGDALAIGELTGDSYGDLVVGASGENRVYVYAGSSLGLSTTPAKVLTAPAGSSSSYGFEVSVADIDGNGAPDLVVGAPVLGNLGQAFAYLGTPGGANSFEYLSVLGSLDSVLTMFGHAFAVGDTDGDTKPELYVGAPTKVTGFLDSGRLFQIRFP